MEKACDLINKYKDISSFKEYNVKIDNYSINIINKQNTLAGIEYNYFYSYKNNSISLDMK